MEAVEAEAEALPIPAPTARRPRAAPDGGADVESCASCNDGYGLVDEVLCREPFFLHSNGITVRCDNAADGDSGMVGGTEYTKRTAAQLRAIDPGPSEDLAATSCTSGITEYVPNV